MDLINYRDIQVGDELIISSSSTFRYLKVLSLPKRQDSSTFRCSEYRVPNLSGKPTYIQYNSNVEEHNTRSSIDLGYRDTLLVKREL